MKLPGDWKDILIHCGAAAALTAASGLAGNALIGAALANAFFMLETRPPAYSIT